MGSEFIIPPLKPQIYVPKKPQLLSHPSGMTVELLDWMGADIDIVNAARVSLGKESQFEWWRYDPICQTFEEKSYFAHYHNVPASWANSYVEEWQHCLSIADAGLLNYLMRERHGTPFEMVQFKFRVKAPIGVIWEWVRHRISSYNIMSTRYVEWDKDYYLPEAEDWRTQVGKVGHYRFEELEDEETQRLYVEAMETAFEYYGMLIDRGLAKEVARNILPMGSMTQMIWSVNLRSLFNFLGLRTDSHALREIQYCARMVEAFANTVVPEAMQTWRRHEKKTP